MSPPSCPAGPSRPSPWSASTCRSPPPCSARATTPWPRTSCSPRPAATPPGTWHHDVEPKVEAGQGPEELSNDLESGARLLDEVAATAPAEHREALTAAATALRDHSLELTARIA